jgi:hypothetical protein
MIHIKTELPFVGWIEKSRTSLGEWTGETIQYLI